MFPRVQALLMSVLPGQLQRVIADGFGPDEKVLPRLRVLLRCRRVMMHEHRLPLTPCARARIPQESKWNRPFMSVGPEELESSGVKTYQLLQRHSITPFSTMSVLGGT
jgi:hypothetical protein